MNRRTFIRVAAGAICLAATGVRAGSEKETVSDNKGLAPSKDMPLVLDKGRRSVRIYTEINKEGFEKTNPHWGVVFKDGKLAGKAILKAFCTPLEFHDALAAAGAHPGNDLTEETTGRVSGGERLIVTASLPGGREGIPLSKVFRDSSGKGFSIRFSGNRKASMEENTGCITCLESCWVGITSNSAYPLIGTFTRFISPNSLFSGNPDILPLMKGRSIILTYRVA